MHQGLQHRTPVGILRIAEQIPEVGVESQITGGAHETHQFAACVEEECERHSAASQGARHGSGTIEVVVEPPQVELIEERDGIGFPVVDGDTDEGDVVLGAAFGGLRELSARLRAMSSRIGPELSMGMTNDLEIAIREGSTMVRIGTALFGERGSAT